MLPCRGCSSQPASQQRREDTLLTASIVLRALVSPRPAGPELAERIVDLVFAGINTISSGATTLPTQPAEPSS